MTNPLDLDLDLLGRCVAGTASPAERQAFDGWLAADPGRRELVAQMEQVWRRAGKLEGRMGMDDDVDVDAKWRALRQAMRPARIVRFPGLRVQTARHSWMYAAAAAVALALGVGMIWKADLGLMIPGTASSAPMREYVTFPGERAEFRLPDGTGVTLSVASRLRVPADYGVDDREVYLTGEAYFDVQHDSAARFLVHTGDVVTEDLGTRFAIRAYAADSTVRVVVAEGRVALRVAEREALLDAGHLARTTPAGEIVTQRDGDIGRYLAWVEGQLVFESTPLGEALPELGRWFDLEFRLGDSALAHRRITASFHDRPDDRMLSGLALTLGVRAERVGRVVTFYEADAPGK